MIGLLTLLTLLLLWARQVADAATPCDGGCNPVAFHHPPSPCTTLLHPTLCLPPPYFTPLLLLWARQRDYPYPYP